MPWKIAIVMLSTRTGEDNVVSYLGNVPFVVVALATSTARATPFLRHTKDSLSLDTNVLAASSPSRR